MAFASWLWSAVVDRFDLTFGAAAAYGAPALAGALACSLAYYVWRRRSRGRPISARGFVRTIFAGRIVWSPSSIVDMKMWALNGLVLAGGYGYLAFGNVFCRDATLAGLNAGFGARPPAAWPAWTVLAMATLFELLAYELAYWFGHFLFHRIPALWEFHKVHHSAEVDDDLHRAAPASGRDPRLHEPDRDRHRRGVRRHDLCSSVPACSRSRCSTATSC